MGLRSAMGMVPQLFIKKAFPTGRTAQMERPGFMRGSLLVQRALLGDGLGVGQNQQAADDDSRDDVGHSGKRTLCKDLFGGLGVDQDVQHRRNDDPGNGMGHDIGDGEGGDLTLVEVALLHIQLLGKQADDHAGEGGGDDPAPPRDAAPGQVDEGMADEADQGAGHRAVHGGQQTEHRVLQADVGVGHRAGDCHKTPQHKEQCCADTNGDKGLDAIVVFHNSALLYNITNDPLGTCRKTA